MPKFILKIFLPNGRLGASIGNIHSQEEAEKRIEDWIESRKAWNNDEDISSFTFTLVEIQKKILKRKIVEETEIKIDWNRVQEETLSSWYVRQRKKGRDSLWTTCFKAPTKEQAMAVVTGYISSSTNFVFEIKNSQTGEIWKPDVTTIPVKKVVWE